MSSHRTARDEAPPRRVLIPPSIPPSVQSGGGAASLSIWNLQGKTMGTYWRARVVARPSNRPDDQESARQVITAALDRVVRLMSPWETSSDLSRFIAAAPGEWVILAPETFSVLMRALEIARLTHGAYDPTIGAVTDLLGFGPSDPSLRQAADSPALEIARAALGYERLEYAPARFAIRQPGKARLDLCSIAKGYAIDLASDQLHASGWTAHFIEIGGEARGRGTKPNGHPWWCGLESPQPISETVAALCESAIATSGNGLRQFDSPSGPVGHIVSPFAPPAAPSKSHSVSVLAPSCMEADVWATALYLLGPETGLPLAKEQHLAARFVLPDPFHGHREIVTPLFSEWLS